MSEPSRPRPETLCARPAEFPRTATEPLAPPLQPSAVYRVAGLDEIDSLYEGRASGFIYARDGHPNAAMLADKLAALEEAEAALVCASGMAAESAILLASLESGGHVVLSNALYGKTVTVVARELSRFGVEHALFDASRPETLRDALRPTTKIVFVETISNPLVRVADIAGLAPIVRDAGARLVVDNTFAPLLCRPLELGAEAVTHSVTKIIGGHSDLIQGALVGSRSLIERATAVASAFGLTGNAFESWLALRGMATLGVRSARACANALALSERLSAHPKVRAVHYPGLSSHPDHALACRMLRGGFGAMAAIDLGGRAQADAFIRSLRHIPFAPSLGDVSTTLSHPWTTSHRGQDPDLLQRNGITPGLIRLSFGVEAPEDLWDEMSDALRRVE